MSKAAWWAAVAAILAIGMMLLGEWSLALAMVALGGVGYVLANAIEDVLARQEEESLTRRS